MLLQVHALKALVSGPSLRSHVDGAAGIESGASNKTRRGLPLARQPRVLLRVHARRWPASLPPFLSGALGGATSIDQSNFWLLAIR